MSIRLLMEQKLYGLYELDDVGTVLYSRMEPEGETPTIAPDDVAGRNFYDDVASFRNVEEFRRLVVQFTRGASPADNFEFDCLYEDCALPVKVLLARIRERVHHDRTKSVLVHIRRAA
ncbi:MAG TPA: hypothetical protein VGW12_03480 [Pyrinomonadaceae bacterium]|nr:hypothetical protein [Pyrinomonadaceae bacterium]